MKYTFPIIRHINEVLEHVAGREDFRIVRQRDYTVITYKNLSSEAFHMDGPDDLAGAIRRECRGIMFDTEGNLISRPFHKFFNIGEKAETFPDAIDVNRISHYETKMDGSMIRPVRINGQIHWCTKKGVTDRSADVRAWVDDGHQQFDEYADQMIKLGFTPIFEWTSPNNRVVLEYAEPCLTLLAVRENLTGDYTHMKLGFDLGDGVMLHAYPENETVCMSTENAVRVPTFVYRERLPLLDFMETVSQSRDIEGYVIVMDDGHRLKVKTEQYCRIHRFINDLGTRRDHYIAQHVLDDTVDDLRPFLAGDNLTRVMNYEAWFSAGIRSKISEITGLRDQLAPLERKDAAAFLKNQAPLTKSIVFRTLDGVDPEEATLGMIAKYVTNQDKHAQLKDWIGGAP